jgi:hypothetical protein
LGLFVSPHRTAPNKQKMSAKRQVFGVITIFFVMSPPAIRNR